MSSVMIIFDCLGALLALWHVYGLVTSKIAKKIIITSYRKEIEPCSFCHYIQLVKTHRMIYVLPILTTFDLEVTWPEVNFWPWPFGDKTYIFRFVLTSGTLWCYYFGSILISSNDTRKKCSFPQTPPLWLFWTLWRHRWPDLKMT